MLIPLFLLVSCLVGFSHADTAKEAHDKSMECAKKCSRFPNVLRCEMECQKTVKTIPHPKGGKHAKPQRTHQKVLHSKSKPQAHAQPQAQPQAHAPQGAKAMTLKGRRVYLIRKN